MKRIGRRAVFTGFCLFMMFFALALPAQAAEKYQNTFRLEKKNYYYYNAEGKKAKGLTKIGKKYYYFNSKGVQRTGWQKIGSDYYYFKIANGEKGYMVTSRTVNGITLKKSGKASRKKKSSRRKLKLLVYSTRLVEKLTDPVMSKTEKLWICFKYVKKTYKYAARRKFRNYSGWVFDYAEDMFYHGKGNCFSYASAFAFLANAAGCRNVYSVSSGGHGWAEVEGKVYDPDWTFASKVDSYFAMSYSLSGVAGRPRYSSNRRYKAKI